MGIDLGDGTVEGPDWSGVATLDESGRYSLEELMGLEAKEWAIVGLDIWGGSRGGGFAVFAIRRALVEAAGGDPAAAAGSDGTIPVTRFEMPRATGRELLHRFEHWSIDARRRGVGAGSLRVEDKVELPYPMSRYGLEPKG